MGNVRMALIDGRIYVSGFLRWQHTYIRVFGPFLFFCVRINYSVYYRKHGLRVSGDRAETS